MASVNVAPELKQVLGAMLFGARQPVSAADMRRVLMAVAENHGAEGRAFAQVTEPDIHSALEQLKADLAAQRVGVQLVEAAGGFRFQTDPGCGPWLRHLLEIDKPSRLSRPTLETLAIIAYRQPAARSEIEAVRGVTVDTIVRNLLELQLIRIMGRSPLPGRPLLYGTTQLFLEHFGLKSLQELPGIEQLCRREEEYERRHRPPPADAAAGEKDGGAEEVKKDARESEPTEEVKTGGIAAVDDGADKDDDEEDDEDEENEADDEAEDEADEASSEPGNGNKGSQKHEPESAQKSD